MKILTLIKYSLDVAEIKVDPATKALRMSGVPEKVGNIDKNVVEAAVRLDAPHARRAGELQRHGDRRHARVEPDLVTHAGGEADVREHRQRPEHHLASRFEAVRPRLDRQPGAALADLVEGEVEEVAGEIPAGGAVQGEALQHLAKLGGCVRQGEGCDVCV